MKLVFLILMLVPAMAEAQTQPRVSCSIWWAYNGLSKLYVSRAMAVEVAERMSRGLPPVSARMRADARQRRQRIEAHVPFGQRLCFADDDSIGTAPTAQAIYLQGSSVVVYTPVPFDDEETVY